MDDEDNLDQGQDFVLDSAEDIPTGLGVASLSNEDLNLLPSTYTGPLTSAELASKIRSSDTGYAANKKALQDQLAAARNVLLNQPTKQSKADWLLGVGSTLLAPGPVGRAGTIGESMANLGKYVTGVSEREKQAELAKQQQLAQFDLSAAQAQVTQDEARRKGLQDLYYRLQNIEAMNARAQAQREQAAKDAEANRANRIEAARIRASSSGTGTRDAYGFGEIVSTAANEAASSLVNLQTLPASVTSGLAGGRETKSVFTAPVDALINSYITKDEEQTYNVEATNLARYIAQVQKGGRVVGASETAETQKGLLIKAGDSQFTRLTKMANGRQKLERAIEVRLASPRTPEGLKEIYRKNLEDIRTAVPFTVADVNAMARAKDKKKTFAQMYPEIGLGGEGSPKPAEAGKKVMLGNREIYHKDDKWYFKDDNTEVPK